MGDKAVIQLLGPFTVTHSGARVSLATRKAEALLAVLAVRPGVEHARERLAALLWPDAPEPQARTSLRQALGQIRSALPGDVVQGGADRIHLDPALADSDTADFERILAHAARDRAPAAELYRGELLLGFPALEDSFDHWLDDERTRLRELAAARLDECVAALSAHGELERAVSVGETLLRVEPTRESAHRALMRLHVARDDRPAAIRQYGRCRDVLRRELELAPSAETERLRQSIVALPSVPVPPSTRVPPPPHGAGDAPPPSRRDRSLLELAGRLPLAVLPFAATGASASSDQAQLFARALAEDVVTELARFRELALIARETLVTVARASRDPMHVASVTGARAVLSGSVIATGERVGVTAALVDTTTGLEIWSERWELRASEFLDALDGLTRKIVSALALGLESSRLGSARTRKPERLDTYECWLRGLECLERGSAEDDERARALFQRALEQSPGFARAHAGLSLAHFNDWSCQAWDRWELRERLAFQSASRAVELDQADHVAQIILARIRAYRRDFDLAEVHAERALALNCNDASTLIQAAFVYAALGRGEKASNLADAALLLHPLHPPWYYPLAAFARLVEQRPGDALQLASRAPDALVDTRACLAVAAAHLGDADLAREHAERYLVEFERKIAPGQPRSARAAVRWFFHVNPFARSSDAEYFATGLRTAGLSAEH